MENQSNKTVRSNKAQIRYLCQYMAAHPDFASGDYRSPMGAIPNNTQWTKLKEALDELGPCRSVEQWKICWRDQKAKARSEGALLKKAKDATGNILPVPNITDTSALVLSAIGKEMAVGFGPEESPIGFSEPQPSTSQCSAQPPLQHKAQRPAPYRRARRTLPPENFLNAQLELNNLVKELIKEVHRSNELKEEHLSFL